MDPPAASRPVADARSLSGLALALAVSTSIVFAAPAHASPQDDLAAKKARAARLEIQDRARPSQVGNAQRAVPPGADGRRGNAEEDRRRRSRDRTRRSRHEGVAPAAQRQGRDPLHGRRQLRPVLDRRDRRARARQPCEVRRSRAPTKTSDCSTSFTSQKRRSASSAKRSRRSRTRPGRSRTAADKALNEVKQAVQVEQNELASVKGDIGQLVDQIAAEKRGCRRRPRARRVPGRAGAGPRRSRRRCPRANAGSGARNAAHRRTAVRRAGAGRGSRRRGRVRVGAGRQAIPIRGRRARTRTTARD